MSATGTNPPASHCNYFVVRKKRFCRIQPKLGEKFCGEHQTPQENETDVGTKIRIVCPLDRKHTCYAHNLKKHLKICNAREGPIEAYIEKGINSGRASNEEPSDSYKLLSSFSTTEIKEVIAKVNKVFSEIVDGKITEKLLQHEVVEEEMLKPEYGDRTKKHLKQASAILGLLQNYQMMGDQTCYIEFGAGRGQLSYWVMKATESNNKGITALLVERASPKHKRDNKLSKTPDEVRRIRADISDLVLDKLDIISNTTNIIGVTKHLCGEATDLAIRCLTNVQINKEKVSGAIMTFCCHHRCRWTPYTGKEFFQENGMTKTDFEMMCGIASWATCGSGFSRERQNECTQEEKEICNNRDKELGLTREEKEEIGRRCKNVLNWGRLFYLEKLGFTCFLHYYVDKNISLENVCIVATKVR